VGGSSKSNAAYLTRLRASLVDVTESLETDENYVNLVRHGGPVEYDDDAQRVTLLEIDGVFVVRHLVVILWSELSDAACSSFRTSN
jgi:hypothetical protein